ncbi:MAG: methyltransferase [Oscillibacter sp.]|jgi:tRNA1Val (adenine37-N6)-methyltransferase|nr:methyltransferase [uncultured Oscillibacter sp.]MCI8812673.1 methyltransferase [Oscillibacter sp.]
MEHWETLKSGGLRFVWEDNLFRPGTDTFLLSSLPRLKPGLRVCDLGCGTGLLGLLLLQRQRDLTVTGVELRPEAAALLEQAAAENSLTDRLTVRRGNLREIRSLLPAGGFDLAVCNPPYYPVGSGKLSPSPALQAARAETACTMEDVCGAAAWLLRWGGALCLVHKPERLADLLCTLRSAALEPKRMRAVCRRAEEPPSLVLLEARRGGKPGLAWEPPMILETAEGRPTEELDRIYFRQEDLP